MIELFTSIEFSAVVLAGIVTVFLPCTYPMVLGYIALLIGNQNTTSVRNTLKTTGWFFTGFGLVYSFFGSIAGVFGQFSQTTLFFHSIKPIVTVAGGAFFILVGLLLLQTIPLPKKLRGIYSVPLPKSLSVHSWWGASVTGAIFATAWSPCLGPVLGGILLLAANSGSVLRGTVLLFLFSLGMAFPMTILAVLYSHTTQYMKWGEKIVPFARIIGGIIFILLGASLFIGDFSYPEGGEIEFLERYI